MSAPSQIYVAVVDDDESACRALSRLDDAPEFREPARALGCAAFFAKTAPGRNVIQAIRGTAHHKDDRPS